MEITEQVKFLLPFKNHKFLCTWSKCNCSWTDDWCEEVKFSVKDGKVQELDLHSSHQRNTQKNSKTEQTNPN